MSKVIYILGSGHCGSTLLSIYLAAQPNVVCAGEVWNLSDLGIPSFEEGGAAWSEAIDIYVTEGGDASSLLNRGKTRFGVFSLARTSERAAIGREQIAFLNALARASDAALVVDNSKGWRRLDMLLAAAPRDVFVLEMVRDGRAVVHAYARKYDGSYWVGLRRWLASVVARWIIRARHPRAKWLKVRYEDFCADYYRELGKVLRFVEHPRNGDPLLPNGTIRLGIGGNRMRRAPAPIVVRLNEDWKSQMPRKMRVAFFIAFGWLNWLNGYKPWR